MEQTQELLQCCSDLRARKTKEHGFVTFHHDLAFNRVFFYFFGGDLFVHLLLLFSFLFFLALVQSSLYRVTSVNDVSQLALMDVVQLRFSAGQSVAALIQQNLFFFFLFSSSPYILTFI
jgi:hypothetical protein